MKTSSEETINALNTRFYRCNAQSFSKTRQGSWAGWNRVMEEVFCHHFCSCATSNARLNNTPREISFVDFAAGNLRFEVFVEQWVQTHCSVCCNGSGGADGAISAKDCQRMESDAESRILHASSVQDVTESNNAATACNSAADDNALRAPFSLRALALDNNERFLGDLAAHVSYPLTGKHFDILSYVLAERSFASFSADSPCPLCETSNMTWDSKADATLAMPLGADSLRFACAPSPAPAKSSFDFAVSFGFMHHILGRTLQRDFLRFVRRVVKPGGILALSFWQFCNSETLACKAAESTAAFCQLPEFSDLQLGEGDYLLGWQKDTTPDAARFCHHFSDEEVAQLLNDVFSDCSMMCFSADGRGGNLNKYALITLPDMP